ncbi:plasmid mobilization protein [Cellulophaga baltica]|uniref:plasmid mobilization protein n=1 Tax=Cellulophaga baltica TaxID=76594 RepID=UPI0037C728E0
MDAINKQRVVFYLNQTDKDLLFNQCNLMQIKTSFFIRNCVLEKLGKPIFEVKATDLDTKSFTSELIKVGVNLNQIARKLNSGVEFSIADQRKVLKDISTLTNDILEIKSKL